MSCASANSRVASGVFRSGGPNPGHLSWSWRRAAVSAALSGQLVAPDAGAKIVMIGDTPTTRKSPKAHAGCGRRFDGGLSEATQVREW
jgi:hypothetical protein